MDQSVLKKMGATQKQNICQIQFVTIAQFRRRMSYFRIFATLVFATLLGACSSPPIMYKISDPETVRVVEGTVVSAKVTQKARNLTATSTAATAVAANNVGNSTVGAVALLVNVLDSAAEDTNQWQMELVVLDDKTQKNEPVFFKRLIQNRAAPAPGDRVRIIFRADDSKSMANLTQYPGLDAPTR